MPFHRFLTPDYSDGIDSIRRSVNNEPLLSPRFISLLVHGTRNEDAPVTLMLAQWGQFIDHDLTSTAQPRTINGSVPRCCGVSDKHPSCAPIKVPSDDPWLIPVNVRCLEFLRSAPAQRPDCTLSWREQNNQVTSFLDASPIYSSNARTSDSARHFHNGLLQFGRGPPQDDACQRGALSMQCIRPGDPRSGEQPGLLAIHHVFVGEHNRIATELAILNPNWSDEKIYQEARRIIGALVQHITFREFLPLVLGRDVSRSFELELEPTGYFRNYNTKINPGVANSFGAAAFRFGHSLIQSSYMRSNQNHEFLNNNVTLHEENSKGDIGSAGSLHRLLRGMAIQRSQKRDEFITAELTNHLFQSESFPFGLDLAAINIQRGRDHGLPPYIQWREPCGLRPIRNWDDLERVVGPNSVQRIRFGYKSVEDIDLFVAGLAERPVAGGLVGPTFACIIAQQFSNLRKSDRFWYENDGFESSFTPSQLQSIRQVSLSHIICRSLGGGTLQPHVFLPSELASNERRLCGFGSMAPIDLIPWLEKDPFLKNESPHIRTAPDNKLVEVLPFNPTLKVIDKIDFMPNGATGIRDPAILFFHGTSTTKEPLVVNGTFLSNKLDFNITRPRPRPSVNDKLTIRPVTLTSNLTKIPLTTTVRPIKTQIKPASVHKFPQKRDTTEQDNKQPRRNPSRRQKLANKTKVKTKEKLTDSESTKQLIIKTPDSGAFEIEISIKPAKSNVSSSNHQQTNNDRLGNNNPNTKVSTRPLTNNGIITYNDFIKAQSPSGYDQYNKPNYNTRPNGYMTIRPDYRPVDYDNLDVPVIRPQYSQNELNHIRPSLNYRPFQRPTQSDSNPNPGYGSTYTNDNASGQRPVYRPTHSNDVTINRPPVQSIYLDRPQQGYGSNNDIQTSVQSSYAINNDNTQTYYSISNDATPIKPNRPITYYDNIDITTQNAPNKYSTPFSYDSNLNQYPQQTYPQHDSNFNPNPIYIDDFNGWDELTTRRPYYQNNQYSGSVNDKTTLKPSSFLSTYNQYRPSIVINKFFNHVTDFFASTTTTRQPLTLSGSFEYSRQQDLLNIDEPKQTDTKTKTDQEAIQPTVATINSLIDILSFDEKSHLRPERMILDETNEELMNISTDTSLLSQLTNTTPVDFNAHLTPERIILDETNEELMNISTDTSLLSQLTNTTPVDFNATKNTNQTINITCLHILTDSQTTDKLTFDDDGYLRPEHMNLHEINHTNANDETVYTDDYIMPALIQLRKFTDTQSQYNDTDLRHFPVNILAESDELPISEIVDMSNRNAFISNIIETTTDATETTTDLEPLTKDELTQN